MTRKEFVTNFLRGQGFTVLEYKSDFFGCQVKVERNGQTQNVTSTVRKVFRNMYEVTFSGDAIKSLDPVIKFRRANVWLLERGFKSIVEVSRKGIIHISSLDGPSWYQAAAKLTKEDALNDALGDQVRYKPVGYIHQMPEEEEE